jgi:hypothetical protein
MHFQEIISRLDLPLEGYIDPHTTLPISIYQFLSAWTKFAPSEYYTYYFEEVVVDMNVWMLQGELMHNIQLSVATLELVIKDAVILVGGEKQHFVIDVESWYQLKLQCVSSLEELKIADKLLKLRVELSLACLVKLKALHDGMEMSGKSSMGLLSSLLSQAVLVTSYITTSRDVPPHHGTTYIIPHLLDL